MADTTDPGGGSTTIVCTPSPNDEVAILHNLIKRVSDIERFLNQLVGADVYANNLSELATDIGNILNGTIMLPSTGSPYGPGGSIPVPDGFSGTVISGNVITTWDNGVVSFQVTPSQGVTAGTFTRANSYISSTTLNYTTASTVHPLKGFTVEVDGGLVSINPSTGAITFSGSTGLYLIGYTGLSYSYPAGAGVDQTVTHGFGDGSSIFYGSLSTTEEVSETNTYFLSGNYFFNRAGFGMPSTVYLQLYDDGTSGATRSATNSSLFIIKLKE